MLGQASRNTFNFVLFGVCMFAANCASAQIPQGLGLGLGQGLGQILQGLQGQITPSTSPVAGQATPGQTQQGGAVISNRARLGDIFDNPNGAQQPANQGASAQPSADPRERIEFQNFLLQSTGRELSIFGADLFRQSPSTFAPADNIPVTPDYVIGPGDEILIRAWGQIDVDFATKVDRSGTISIPKVGALNVAGIKYQDLTSFLRTSFSRIYRNFELTVSLGRLRSIQVYVVGQAKRPGTYTVSSLSTLVTALFSVGGPSTRGSMRSIQLKRGSKVVADFDLYDMLVSGDKSKDVQLLPGDVIYIPPVGQLAAISGSVNVPAIYELKMNTPLSELVRWSGGLSTTAQGQKVSVERISDRKVRKVEEFTLDADGLSHAVRDGDLVTVFSLQPRFDNAVTLRGNVAQPGRFPWRAGMRVTDLIPEKEALISRDYWQRLNQIVGIDNNVSRLLNQQRSTDANLEIQDFLVRQGDDSINQTVAEAIRMRQIAADALKLGGQRQQSLFQQGPSQQGQPLQLQPLSSVLITPGMDPLRLVNQIKPSLNEVNWDYALVERFRRESLSTVLIPFHLGKAVMEGDPQQNITLEPGDVITIFSKEDIQVSSAKQTRFIRLEGEINSGGIYQIQPGETLRQLVARIGGLAPTAYLFGSELTRESTRLQQQKNLEESLNRLERDVQRMAATRSGGDASTTQAQAANQQNLIAKLRQIRATGRIVLAIPEDGTSRDLPDLPLEDGDRFYVPSQPSMVNVFGAVYNENSYIYKPERHFSDYLEQAGGPTRDSDKSSVYLLRADGSVVSKRQTGFLSGYIGGSLDHVRMMPGDSIVVPEELDKSTWMRNIMDITQVFYQLGLGVAALKVLRQ